MHREDTGAAPVALDAAGGKSGSAPLGQSADLALEKKPVPKAAFKTGAWGNVAARPSLIPSLCTHFARAGIEWRR